MSITSNFFLTFSEKAVILHPQDGAGRTEGDPPLDKVLCYIAPLVHTRTAAYAFIIYTVYMHMVIVRSHNYSF